MRAHCSPPTARPCACSPATASGWSGATAPARPPPCASWRARPSRMPGRSTRTGEIGYLPQDPKEGDLDVLARDRVLSARGLDTLLTDLEKQQALMAEVADDDARDKRDPPLRPARGAIRRAGRLRRRKRSRPDLREPRPARTGADAAIAHAVRGSAPPGGAGAHPVRRVGYRCRFGDHAAARRADQPPRRRFAGLAAGFPAGAHRRAGGHQPQRRIGRRRRQPGVVPGCRARRGRRLQHGLAEVPRRPRHRRAASPPGTRQRRTQGRRAA